MTASHKFCCVPNCGKSFSDGVLHAFPNPIKENERFVAWVNAVGTSISSLDHQFIYRNRKICHFHFENKYKTWSRRLSVGAVPTLHMSGLRDSRTVPKQYEKLLEIVSAPGVLELGHVTYKQTTETEFWKRVASELNSVPGGVYKNPFKWFKMWCNWKHNTKCKVRNATKETNTTFTVHELQLLKLLNVPVDSLESDDGLEEMNEQYPFEVVDCVEIDNETKPAEMEDGKIEFDSLDNDIEEEAEQETQKVEENTFKRRKLASPTNSPEQSDINELERYRLRQRDEELRLKAIELKLKHKELKLKESETTKANSLVNIEEEKLKCLQNIAGMLKELVDITKNGHPPK